MAVRCRGPINDRPRDLRLHRHVGELELDCLVLGDGHAERLALLCISQRRIETRLCDTDRQRRDRDPSAGQRVQELPVTSTAHPQQVRRRDLAVLEAQRVRVGGMPPELAI